MTTLPFEEAKWISEQKIPFKESDRKTVGVLLKNCIPALFDSYCKILHPFEETPHEADILEQEKSSDQLTGITFEHTQNEGIRITETRKDGTEVDAYQSYLERVRIYKSKHWDFVTWQSLTEKYGLVFHKAIEIRSFTKKFQKIGWPRNLSFPKEGYLVRPKFIQLLEILKLHTVGDELIIYQIVPNTIYRDRKVEDLVKCSFKDVLNYFEEDFIGYLYAVDKSWLVYTDTDSYFTIVSGSKSLIQSLLQSELEVLECDSSTRIDEFSDSINQETVTIKKQNDSLITRILKLFKS